MRVADQYDLVVLGAGPGGYVAAIRAAQLGMRVAVVEREHVGGVCLHKGCVPSKTLLRSAEVYRTVRRADEFGIAANNLAIDVGKIMARKTSVVQQLHKGVEHLLSKHKVDIVHGIGRIMGPSIFAPQAGTIAVEQSDGESVTLVPKHVVIATGSKPRQLAGLTVDGVRVLHSDHALKLEKFPRSMLIVGGGAIGIEWASLLNDFGVEVTIVEAADRLLPTEDADISREMARLLKKRKVKLLTRAEIMTEATTVSETEVALTATQGEVQKQLVAEQVLLCVGREPRIDDIGLANTDIQVDGGAIAVNPFMQTAESHIYAIGDVVGGMQLAHVASREGIIAVEHMAGRDPLPLDERQLPRCTYSHPEVASVGLSEQQAKAQGFKVTVGKIPFRGIGKAVVGGDVDGFVKVVADRETDDVLGVHAIGPHVTDMIAEAGFGLLLNATPWEMSQVIHPHPTLSEAIGEAALAAIGRPIHGI